MIRRFVVVACAVLVFCSSVSLTYTAEIQSQWTSYFGAAAGDMPKGFNWSTYLAMKDNPVPWAHTFRQILWVPRDRQFFSSEPAAALGNDREFKSFIDQVRSVGAKRDIVIPVGARLMGFDEGHVNRYMDIIKKDNANSWKKFVYEFAVLVDTIPGVGERIYWQIDNEVNSTEYTSAIRQWAGQSIAISKSEKFYANDRFVIPYYFEYVFAPTVEALRAASLKVFGTENKIKILPSTLAGAFLPESMKWFDDFLSYEIRGDYAKSLAGKKVYELCDIVGIHYLVSRADDTWSSVLDELYRKWVGKGRIRGIWSTEEGGKWLANRGRGASTALKVTARYLHYWGKRSLNPDQGRCLFWGWRIGSPGTTGEEAMDALYAFVADNKLKEPDNTLEVYPRSNLEKYLFQIDTGIKKCFAVLFPKNDTDAIKLKQIKLGVLGWNKDVSAKILIYTMKGYSLLVPSVIRDGNIYTVTLPQDVVLSDQATALLLLQENG
jgi:hypothetical protein